MTDKANSADALIRATLGRFQSQNPNQSDRHAAIGQELVKRYAMWVHRAVSIVAQSAAAVPFKLFRVAGSPQAAKDTVGFRSEWKLPSARTKAFIEGRMDLQPSAYVKAATRGAIENLIEIDRHPVLDVLNNVNRWQDGYAYRESKYADLQIFGRAFTNVIAPGGTPSELWRMLPQRMHVIKSVTEFISHFEMQYDTTRQVFPVDEVIWYHLYDPEDPWGGRGPLEAWVDTIDSSLEIQQFQKQLMERRGSPDFVINTEKPMDRKEQRAFRSDWRRMFGRLFGRSTEAIGFMSGGTIEKLGQTNRELEFGASEDRKRDQIFTAFGVPKSFADVSEIRANSREAKQQFFELTVWPLIQRVEDTDNAQLLPMFGDGMILVHENPIPDDEAIRVIERESRLKSGSTIDELRMEEGLEPWNEDWSKAALLRQDVTLAERITDEPEPVVMPGEDPPEAPESEEPPDDAPEPPAKALAVDDVLKLAKLTVDASAPVTASQQSEPEKIRIFPPVDVLQALVRTKQHAPASAPDITLPPITVQITNPMAAPGDVTVHVPEQKAPTVEVHPPSVTVEAPSIEVLPAVTNVAAPSVTVEAPSVEVLPAVTNVAAPSVTVEAPSVEVTSPDITVESPTVNVEAPSVEVTPPNVIVEGSTVNVEPPDIEIHNPAVTVDAPDITVEAPIVISPVEVNIKDKDE